jgi:DHA2 family multidrug resistance protein
MPIVGRFVHRYSPKLFVFFGIILTAFSTLLMARFTLGVDFDTVLWPRIYMGLGMGVLFIPLTTLTIAGISKEGMGNATAIYNLIRNIGGSIGIAIVTTMVSRRAQVHQSRLVDHLTPFDPLYSLRSQQAATLLQQKGFDPVTAKYGGLGVIYENTLKQASMLAFADVFFLLSLLMLFLIPLVIFMRNTGASKDPAPAGE